MNDQSFINKFQVPKAAYSFLNQMFTREEIDFVTQMDQDTFTAADVKQMGKEEPLEFIRNCYKRGIISIVDEAKGSYKISDFYGRLDIFSITETDIYHSFPKKDRKALDEWYFEAYYNGLDKDTMIRPTSDEIMPLKEVFNFIDRQDRPVYLNYCDCRSLGGDCGLPTRTCITYKDGINSFAHRGLSERITKEKAKEIVIAADKKGLMHTVNQNGICNCCSDCCYLFRGQRRRGSAGFWPRSSYVIELKDTDCIACGKCVRTCHFHVFKKENRIEADTLKCIGCGICVQGCPADALKLKKIL